ncbi:unnamed protein product [Periconia digitata]|uniref:Uncharacterized protein n=1 Tax=Periconia digitata TaxID=1303443 RepID=A0A9W4XX27_9PLEO|nr:unnamed protein product [Periconia digitata]
MQECVLGLPNCPLLLLFIAAHRKQSYCLAAKRKKKSSSLDAAPGRTYVVGSNCSTVSTWSPFTARTHHAAAQTVCQSPIILPATEPRNHPHAAQRAVMWPLYVGPSARGAPTGPLAPKQLHRNRNSTVLACFSSPVSTRTHHGRNKLIAIARRVPITIQPYPPQLPFAPSPYETQAFVSTDVAAVAQHLDHDIRQCAGTPERHQTPSNQPVHLPPPVGHCQQQPDQCHEQRRPGYHQRRADLDVVRLEVNRTIWVFLVVVLPFLDRHVATTEPDPKENVKHRSAKARRERHDGKPESRHGNVSHEIPKRVSHCEDVPLPLRWQSS